MLVWRSNCTERYHHISFIFLHRLTMCGNFTLKLSVIHPGCITASVSTETHTHASNHTTLVLDIFNSIGSLLYRVIKLSIHYTTMNEKFRNKDEIGESGQ
jgi:hypothetical protein